MAHGQALAERIWLMHDAVAKHWEEVKHAEELLAYEETRRRHMADMTVAIERPLIDFPSLYAAPPTTESLKRKGLLSRLLEKLRE
jgi:hypothetical protein